MQIVSLHGIPFALSEGRGFDSRADTRRPLHTACRAGGCSHEICIYKEKAESNSPREALAAHSQQTDKGGARDIHEDS